MPKRVLNVGNCSFDHDAIRRLIEGNFDAEVVAAQGTDDALEALRRAPFDLVLANRQFASSAALGIDLIRQMKSDPQRGATPVMLVSNYPDAQQEAIAAGAEPGFGKAELDREETRQKLARFLGP